MCVLSAQTALNRECEALPKGTASAQTEKSTGWTHRTGKLYSAPHLVSCIFFPCPGGCRCRGFHSRLSVDDLLEATGAKIVAFARPRQRNGAELAAASSGSKALPVAAAAATAEAAAMDRKTGQVEDAPVSLTNAPTLSRPVSVPFALGSISENVRGAPSVGEENRSEGREESDDHVHGANTAHRKRAPDVENETSLTATAAEKSRSWERQGPTDGKVAVKDEVRAEAESSLRVISAAMRVVTVVLSALAACDGENERLRRSAGRGALPDGGLAVFPDNCGDDNSNSSGAGVGPILGEEGMAGAGAASSTELPAARRRRTENRNGPGMVQKAADGGNTRDKSSGAAVDGVDAAFSSVRLDEPSQEDGAVATQSGIDGAREAPIPVTPVNDDPVDDSSAGDTRRTVGAVTEMRSVGGATAYGRELARAAGTPTVDAIGGDVHLVALVAGKRSLTRLLHFVDLVSYIFLVLFLFTMVYLLYVYILS